MQRCKQCESPLAKTDVSCVNCGEIIVSAAPKKNMKKRFGTVVTVLFIISAALTVVALFTSYVGSFMTYMGATIVLLMVKKSADEMSSSEQ
jgi:preprotein translocase subunit SecY